MNTSSVPAHARAVVVGGGVIGCSTAYHLAKLGWTDVELPRFRGRYSAWVSSSLLIIIFIV